jgi:hypothetical protein
VGSNPTLSAIAFRSFIFSDLRFQSLSKWRDPRSLRPKRQRKRHFRDKPEDQHLHGFFELGLEVLRIEKVPG